MNNPEFEQDILQSIDKSGYSEKKTDLQMDRKGTGNQQVKQFNRLTKKPAQQDPIVLLKKKKTEIIFQAE